LTTDGEPLGDDTVKISPILKPAPGDNILTEFRVETTVARTVEVMI
jgi:hypothetical protein